MGRGAYRTVPDGDVRAQATEFVQQRFVTEAQAAIEINQLENQDEPVTVRKVPTGLVGDMMNALRGRRLLGADYMPPAWIGGSCPADPRRILSTATGLVDLEGAAAGRADCLTPPTPAYFTLNAVPYAFDPTAPAPTEWLAFLDALWPGDQETIECLRECFGYLLTLDTSMQKILFLLGPPRAGKGTIAGVIRNTVGGGNVAGPTLNGLATNFGLAPLLDKSVAIIDDARIGGRTDTAVVTERLLTISGEGVLTVDRKHREPVTGKLPTRIVILSNEMPRLADASGALTSRLIVLRLTRSWTGQEDPTLADRLRRESPGILLWAIEGWRRLQDRGRFAQPAAGADLLWALGNLTSPAGQFVREQCVVQASGEVEIADLYQAWQAWCSAQGEVRPGTHQTFGQQIRAVVPEIGCSRREWAGKRYRVYTGIRLRTEADPEPED